jgi:hypothetical protein
VAAQWDAHHRVRRRRRGRSLVADGLYSLTSTGVTLRFRGAPAYGAAKLSEVLLKSSAVSAGNGASGAMDQ